jgi:hypothetical protein
MSLGDDDSMSSIGRSTDIQKVRASGRPAQLIIHTTTPSRILRHNISDEEAEMLAGGRREHLWAGFWAMVGAALAVARSAVDALFKAFWEAPSDALNFAHVIDVIIFVATTSVAVALAIVAVGRGSDKTHGKGLLAEIRARTAVETRHQRN